MKLLFVGQNLQIGGIQKALINTLKELKKENIKKNIDSDIEIDLFLFGDGVLIKDIPYKVNLYSGSLFLRLISTPYSVVKDKGNIFHLLLRIVGMVIVRIIGSEKFYRQLFKMQKKLDKYDYAISYFNDVPYGYFNRGTSQFVDEFVDASKKIAWVHTDPIKAGFKYRTTMNTYRNFDNIVCVSNACRENLIELIPEYQKKINVVNNLFPIEEIKTKAMEYTPFKTKGISIVSIGRIENSTKQFHLIPKLCKMLKDDSITNFHWTVVGDGPDFVTNNLLVKNLGVSDLIEFVGNKDNPYPYIEKSDIFVLTSAYEGYPMVIGEALVLGTPVVTTCFPSASEQITEDFNGIITEMELESIFSVLKSLLINPDEIERMKTNINNSVFTNKKSMDQFLEVVKIG
ncbi:glycosyltransferase involved in cell wall biosynthesis [Psychrobacillus insolitus]|uniref:Glycosyltransferase involved in cell wall biosynthesis n=1 Tax=Psychrobacillus insolitus TaxID=1461 RepID=A0A2W7MQ93_9BACI|nr:glycosyltransferase [Psychrobacillus insolitus]PZX04824.1 glycosyltransferase involved in cell wall biosynthesis [Psychrobacillus insolitus]